MYARSSTGSSRAPATRAVLPAQAGSSVRYGCPAASAAISATRCRPKPMVAWMYGSTRSRSRAAYAIATGREPPEPYPATASRRATACSAPRLSPRPRNGLVVAQASPTATSPSTTGTPPGAYSRTMSCSPASGRTSSSGVPANQRSSTPLAAQRRLPARRLPQPPGRGVRRADDERQTPGAVVGGQGQHGVRRVVRQRAARTRRRSVRGPVVPRVVGEADRRPVFDRCEPERSQPTRHRGCGDRSRRPPGRPRAPRPRSGPRRSAGCRPPRSSSPVRSPARRGVRSAPAASAATDARAASITGRRPVTVSNCSSPSWRPPVADGGMQVQLVRPADRPGRAGCRRPRAARPASPGTSGAARRAPGGTGSPRAGSSPPTPASAVAPGSAGSRSSTTHRAAGAGQQQRGGQSGGSGAEHHHLAYGSSIETSGAAVELAHGASFVASPWSCDRLLTYQVTRAHFLLTTASGPAQPVGIAELDRPQHLDQPVGGPSEMATVGAERQVQQLGRRLLGRCAGAGTCAPAPGGARRRPAHRPARRSPRAATAGQGGRADRSRPAAPARWSAAADPVETAGPGQPAQGGPDGGVERGPGQRQRTQQGRRAADRSPRSARGSPSSRRTPRPGTAGGPSRTGVIVWPPSSQRPASGSARGSRSSAP